MTALIHSTWLQSTWLRRSIVIFVDILLWGAGLWLALQLRFEGSLPPFYVRRIPLAFAVLVSFRLTAFYLGGLFHGIRRYAGMPELRNILVATTSSTLGFIATGLIVPPTAMPRSVYVGEWITFIVLVGGVRFLIRIVREHPGASANRWDRHAHRRRRRRGGEPPPGRAAAPRRQVVDRRFPR